jgi:response regulator RpfG family c-di-GMP phosphodiesterase
VREDTAAPPRIGRSGELIRAVKRQDENWDSSGYPDGLRDVSIPRASRIIMFAGTFDAMTTKRRYLRPLGEEVAREELMRFRGELFDPKIADAELASDFWKRCSRQRNACIHVHESCK